MRIAREDKERRHAAAAGRICGRRCARRTGKAERLLTSQPARQGRYDTACFITTGAMRHASR